MSQLSSYVATVFHSTPGLPIQSFYCQFDLSEAKPVCHVLLSPAFISHADCKQIWGSFLHLWSLFSLHNYFRCLDLVWLQQQTCLPHYLPFPVKLSSLFCFLNLSFQSNGSTLVLLSRFLCNSVPVTSQCSLPFSSVYFGCLFFSLGLTFFK